VIGEIDGPVLLVGHSGRGGESDRPSVQVPGARHRPSIVQHDLPGGGAEFTLAPEGFHESFCADIPADDAAFYAISQRPLAGISLSEAAPTPAWPSRPVWTVLPTADHCIDPGVHRLSYERMDAQITEIEGSSRVAMISYAKEVAEVVMTAYRAVPQT
jgi:hypothetical protein